MPPFCPIHRLGILGRVDALRQSVLVFVGAGIGANGRYWAGVAMATRFGAAFPIGTLAVNWVGSFLMGLLMSLAISGEWSASWRVFLAAGCLGGFTTMSAFSYESLALLNARSYAPAALYAALSLFGGIAMAWAGFALPRLWLGS